MNAYDFDGTIYNGDSGVDFIKFIFAKKTYMMIKHLIKFSKTFFMYKSGKIEFKEMKENLFSFVKDIDNLDKYVEDFVVKNKNKIKPYYNENRKEDDIIISASLDFYLIPLCNSMGINNIICTNYDVNKGKILGQNCKGNEKVLRFQKIYGKNTILEKAYGDSKGDIELLNYAKQGFVVEDNKLHEYKKGYKF